MENFNEGITLIEDGKEIKDWRGFLDKEIKTPKEKLTYVKVSNLFYNTEDYLEGSDFHFSDGIRRGLRLEINPNDLITEWVGVVLHENGIEKEDMLHALENESSRSKKYDSYWKDIRPYDYIGRSRYFTELSKYYNYFNKEQINITIFEDMCSNPLFEINKVCNFLGVTEFEKIEFAHLNKNIYDSRNITSSLKFLKEKLYEEVFNLSELIGVDLIEKWSFER